MERFQKQEKIESDPSMIYKFDVIVFGFWDASPNDLKDSTVLNHVAPNTESDGSFIFCPVWVSESVFRMETIRPNNLYVKYLDTMSVKRKDMMTKYPFFIEKVGDVLSIYKAHTASGYIYGDA